MEHCRLQSRLNSFALLEHQVEPQNEIGSGSTVTPLPVDEALAEEIYYPVNLTTITKKQDH